MPHGRELALRCLGGVIASLLPGDREAGMRVMQYALEAYMDDEPGPIKLPASTEAHAADPTPPTQVEPDDPKVVVLDHVRKMVARRKATALMALAVAASCVIATMSSLSPVLFEAVKKVQLLG